MALCQEVRLRPPESSSRRSSDLNSPRETLPIDAFAWGESHILARLWVARKSQLQAHKARPSTLAPTSTTKH
jgi:hypothetical protein